MPGVKERQRMLETQAQRRVNEAKQKAKIHMATLGYLDRTTGTTVSPTIDDTEKARRERERGNAQRRWSR